MVRRLLDTNDVVLQHVVNLRIADFAGASDVFTSSALEQIIGNLSQLQSFRFVIRFLFYPILCSFDTRIPVSKVSSYGPGFDTLQLERPQADTRMRHLQIRSMLASCSPLRHQPPSLEISRHRNEHGHPPPLFATSLLPSIQYFLYRGRAKPYDTFRTPQISQDSCEKLSS